MDGKEKNKDVEQLMQLLRKADLDVFFEPLQHIGVQRVAHLQDMRPVDFSEVGMSNLEQTRLRRCMKDEKSWKWTRLSEMVLRKPTTDRAGSSEKRVSSGSGSGIAATAKTRGLDHGAAALNAIAAWKPQKPSWSIATNAVFRERHRHGPLDKAGSVYEGLHRLSGGEERQVFLVQLDNTRVEGRAFRKEIALLHGLSQPNVMKFHGVVFEQPPYLVIDMCLRGTLSEELVLRGSAFLLMDLFEMAVQVADGMKYLEAKGLVHGELKASNILMKSARQCQVANFNLAQPMAAFYHGDYDDYCNPAASSFQWLAPEVIKSNQYTHAGDVWSFGCLLWEMTSYGKLPWSGCNAVQVVAETDFPCRRRLARPTHCPDDLYALMHKCWSHEAKDRPLFAAMDTLTKQCTPKQLIACETIEHCSAPQLPLEAGTLVTVVNNDPQEEVWFGQNCHGQYGEFLPSSVTYSDDILNGQRNSYLAQEAGSKRSSKSSTGGDPNISQPYDVKKLPVEPDVQKLIEELTGMKVSNQAGGESSEGGQSGATTALPHRSLTTTVSSPTSHNLSAMRHRVLTNRQPKPPSLRSFTPEATPPSRSLASQSQPASIATPNLYNHQLALAPRPDSANRLRVPDSPAVVPFQRKVLMRHMTDPAIAMPVAMAAASPVFRFPEVGTGDRYTPSLHEETPVVTEVNDAGEAIYDVPKKECRRSEADYEDVTTRSSLNASLQEECVNYFIDSDSGYSPSNVNSPLSEVARHKATWVETGHVPHTTNAGSALAMQQNFLRLPPGGHDTEPHYRAPRISPTSSSKRSGSPSLQGSSPRQSLQSDVQTSSSKPSPTGHLDSPQASYHADSPPSPEQAAEHHSPGLGKRPPPVPIRDPETALSKPDLVRSGSGNTFIKPSTPSDCASPVPSIQIHRPRAGSVSSGASGCDYLPGGPAFNASPPAMERIQRGWQRICSRQKLINSRQPCNLRASERRYRPAAMAAAANNLRMTGDGKQQLTRQKSNPMIAMAGLQRGYSPSYENTQAPCGLFRTKSSPNLQSMDMQ